MTHPDQFPDDSNLPAKGSGEAMPENQSGSEHEIHAEFTSTVMPALQNYLKWYPRLLQNRITTSVHEYSYKRTHIPRDPFRHTFMKYVVQQDQGLDVRFIEEPDKSDQQNTESRLTVLFSRDAAISDHFHSEILKDERLTPKGTRDNILMYSRFLEDITDDTWAYSPGVVVENDTNKIKRNDFLPLFVDSETQSLSQQGDELLKNGYMTHFMLKVMRSMIHLRRFDDDPRAPSKDEISEREATYIALHKLGYRPFNIEQLYGMAATAFRIQNYDINWEDY